MASAADYNAYALWRDDFRGTLNVGDYIWGGNDIIKIVSKTNGTIFEGTAMDRYYPDKKYKVTGIEQSGKDPWTYTFYVEEIPAVNLSTADVTATASTYNGSALTPTIKIGDTTLTNGKDYTYTVTDSKNEVVDSVVNAGLRVSTSESRVCTALLIG